MEKQIGKPLFTNRELIFLAVPLIIEQVLNCVVGLVDTMMVAEVGEAAVSAISLVDSINQLMIYMFSALATGGAVVIGQYMGREDLQRANRSAEQLFVAISGLSLIVMALLYVGKNAVIDLVFGEIAPDVRGYTETYYTYIIGSFPFIALYNCGAAVFRTMGNSRISLYTSAGMNVIHIIGNAILINHMDMGVAGAGLSTFVSRICAAVFITVLLCRQSLPVHLSKDFRLRIRWEYTKRILTIGIPSGIENSIFHLGKVFITGLVSGFGTSAIAVNAAAHSIAGFHYPPVNAVGLAMLTVASRCAGKGDYEQIRQQTRKLMLFSYLLTFVYMLIFHFGITPALLQRYHLGAESYALASTMLLWDSVFSIFIRPFAFALPNTLRAAGDVRYTMAMSIAVMWSTRVGLAYLLSYFGMGLLGVWIAQWADFLVRAVAVYLRYRGTAWQKKKVI